MSVSSHISNATRKQPKLLTLKVQTVQGDKTKETAFERIGGAPAVKAAVDLLYEKLLSDGNCRQFFANTDMGRLKAHQVPRSCLLC